MLNSLKSILCLQDPRKNAGLALARLVTQYDMQSFSFREEIVSSRRKGTSRQIALGAWLIPWCAEGPRGVLDFENAIPAVTYDLRRTGIGILIRRKLELDTVTVALPDIEGDWRFFLCHVCHRSERPGSWFLHGLQVQKLLEPEPWAVSQFRSHIEGRDGAPDLSQILAAVRQS